MSGESDDRESDDGESDDSESGDNETSEEHCNISDRLHPLIEALKRQVEIETTLIEETKKLEEDGYFVVMSSVTAIIKNYNNAQKTTCYINDLVEAIQDAIEDAMFKQDKNRDVNSFRMNLQVEFVNRLIRLSKDTYSSSQIRTQVYSILNSTRKEMQNLQSVGASTNAHRAYIKYLIEKHLDE